MQRIGKRLKQAREARGLSQEEAAGTRMATRTLSRLESGIGNPTLDTLVSLAKVYGTTVSFFLDEPPILPESPGGVQEAIALLVAFEATPPALKAGLLTLIFDDEEYLSVFEDPGQRTRAAEKLGEVREVFEP